MNIGTAAIAVSRTVVQQGVKKVVVTATKNSVKPLIKTVATEVVKAKVDYTAEKGKVVNKNDLTLVKKVVVGVAADALGGAVKVKAAQLKVVTPKQAVKQIREAGKRLTTQARLDISKQAGIKQVRTKAVNEEISKSVGKTATGGVANYINADKK